MNSILKGKQIKKNKRDNILPLHIKISYLLIIQHFTVVVSLRFCPAAHHSESNRACSRLSEEQRLMATGRMAMISTSGSRAGRKLWDSVGQGD